MMMSGGQLREEDLFCVQVKIGYGKGGMNPVRDSTTFYRPTKSGAVGDDFVVGVLPGGI